MGGVMIGGASLAVRERALILDMDGLLYLGDTPLPGLVDFIDALERRSPGYACLTNNSTLRSADCSAKLAAMGVSVPPERIVTAADAAGSHLARTLPLGSSVYVVGEAPMRESVERAGMRITDESPVAVVVGVDRELTYDKLTAAIRALRSGARLVAANLDPLMLQSDGVSAGSGAIAAILTYCVPVEPECVGKPNAAIFQLAFDVLRVTSGQAAMVGDSLVADIQGGRDNGTATVLLLSGSTRPGSVLDPVPDLVFDGLIDFTDYLTGGS
jgi:Predicted sugar phosphatases of the HAD superfamily